MTTSMHPHHNKSLQIRPGLGIFLVIPLLLTSTIAQAEWHHFGYFRVGSNFNNQASCLQLPGANTKYRLGNECDHYGEMAIENSQVINANYTVKARVMGQIYFADQQDLSQYDAEWNQYMIEAQNTTAQSAFNGSKLWLGKRYYRRKDIHISDFFYWANNGTGIGIEDFKLGNSQLAYAYKTNELDNGKTLQSHDIQLYDIPLSAQGKLNLGIEQQSADQTGTDSGLQLHAQVHYAFQKDNFFKITAQYGEGLGANLDMSGGQGKTTRLIGESLFEITPKNALFSTLVYEKTDQQSEWRSLGFRGVHFLSQHYSVAAEVGHDQVSPDNENTRTLNKVTLALQWKPNPGFWQRPALRLYTTYGDWNLAAQQAGLAGGTSGVYGADRQGFFTGIQLESWW